MYITIDWPIYEVVGLGTHLWRLTLLNVSKWGLTLLDIGLWLSWLDVALLRESWLWLHEDGLLSILHVSVEHFFPDFPFDASSNNNNSNGDDDKEAAADPEGIDESPAYIVLGWFVLATGIISAV